MSDNPGTPKGGEIYPLYHALWPLQVMRILEHDWPAPTTAWDPPAQNQKPTRVAIIDTSVALAHPNLKDAIRRDLSIDLLSAPFGSFPYYETAPQGQREDKSSAKDKLAKAMKESQEVDEGGDGLEYETLKTLELRALDIDTDTDVAVGTTHAEDLLKELKVRLQPGKKVLYGDLDEGLRPAVGPAFSAHGTAVAGLVGARPASVHIQQRERVLPFAGVDPFCEIVSIATGFDPDPEPLIVALLFAELVQANVVLIPRDFPDPFRTPPILYDQPNDQLNRSDLGEAVYPVTMTQREKELWDDLRKILVNVSKKRPIVCAAGNSASKNVIYPARLANDRNGIIAVGAVDADGVRAAYSCFGKKVTVLAPSNDDERFDREEVRLDDQNPDFDTKLGKDLRPFSYLDVISTDVPGRYGYNRSAFRHVYERRQDDENRWPSKEPVIRDFGSLFCRFGGTSAAAALVAGFISLGMTQRQIDPKIGGVAIKEWLLSKSKIVKDLDIPVPSWTGEPDFTQRPPIDIGRTSKDAA